MSKNTKKTKSIKPDPFIATTVERMTDQDVRERFKQFGDNIGPITDSTRGMYKKKLISLMTNADRNREIIPSPPVPHKSIPTTSVTPRPHPPPSAVNNGARVLDKLDEALGLTEASQLPSEQQMKGDPQAIALVTAMNNESIRKAFAELGEDPGPIVATTRPIYEKRLIKMKTREIRRVKYGYVGKDEFSSGDEDMEWS